MVPCMEDFIQSLFHWVNLCLKFPLDYNGSRIIENVLKKVFK